MSQSFPGTIDPTSTSGTALATILSSWAAAENTLNSGASAPSYRVPGTLWLDTTTAANTILKIYDGTVWLNLGFINATAHATSRPSFYVSKSANQTGIANGVATKMVWGTESFDIGSQFASNTFTCIYPGIYIFTASLNYGAGTITSSGMYCNFYKNGTSYVACSTIGVANFGSPTGSVIANMAVGDTMDVYALHSTGGPTYQVDVSVATWFMGAML